MPLSVNMGECSGRSQTVSVSAAVSSLSYPRCKGNSMDSPTSSDRQPNVLLIEDEPRYREMLSEAIAAMGFGVRGTATSEQALRALSTSTYEVAILDLNLPGMNGMDLFEISHRDYPLLQVIILTGFGSLDAAKRAMRLDAVDL